MPTRVISMVPSWTETLLECGVNVVGRTRYCIHPDERVRGIAVVGGTKDINIEKACALDADLMILDREENPQSMSENAPCAVLSTHVRSCHDLPIELTRIARQIPDQEVQNRLLSLSERWSAVIAKNKNRKPIHSTQELLQLPGVEKWLIEPASIIGDEWQIAYVIWKNPWMAVGRETFIASMLEQIGIGKKRIWPGDDQNYPEFTISDVPKNLIMLFSSEPYPFRRQEHELKNLNVSASALANGESFSWFGLRALQFLEHVHASTR